MRGWQRPLRGWQRLLRGSVPPMGPQEPAQGPAAALEALKQRACEAVERSAARLGGLSRDIWSRPELAYEELGAHDTMSRFFGGGELPGAAWAVRPRYELPTAFRADWGTAAPPPARPLRIAFLCEYDALPGIGHACGHNLIAEVGAGAALGLKAALESLPQPPAVAVQVRALPRAEAVAWVPAGRSGADRRRLCCRSRCWGRLRRNKEEGK